MCMYIYTCACMYALAQNKLNFIKIIIYIYSKNNFIKKGINPPIIPPNKGKKKGEWYG